MFAAHCCNKQRNACAARRTHEVEEVLGVDGLLFLDYQGLRVSEKSSLLGSS